MKHGVSLDVVFVGVAGPLAQSESIAVQSELAAAGIRTTIKLSPATTFFAPEGPLRTGQFTMSDQQWIGGADPEQTVEFACSQIGPDGVNVTRFCDRRFEAAFADQAVAADDGRRARDFIAMQRVVRERLPLIPLHYITNFDVIGRRVSGFARNMLEYPVGVENWDAR
jgi:ABC-type transport system substrate-binding protein